MKKFVVIQKCMFVSQRSSNFA